MTEHKQDGLISEPVISKESFNLLSSDGKTTLHGFVWRVPSIDYKGIFQLVHGMVEFIDRFDEFARYLAKSGYIVIGHDQLMHGDSVPVGKERGFLELNHGALDLVNDVDKVRNFAVEHFGKLPYIILGHSMGSFVVRVYLQNYASGIDGAVIMGTGWQSPRLMDVTKALSFNLVKAHGKDYRSKFLDACVLGSYAAKFAGEDSSAWLSHNLESRKAYKSDPRTQFRFSAASYHELFVLVQRSCRKKLIAQMPKDLPMFIVSGSKDSVGDSGKGPEKLFTALRGMQFRDVSIKLYEGDRHELLQELDRSEVFFDICSWADEHVK